MPGFLNTRLVDCTLAFLSGGFSLSSEPGLLSSGDRNGLESILPCSSSIVVVKTRQDSLIRHRRIGEWELRAKILTRKHVPALETRHALVLALHLEDGTTIIKILFPLHSSSCCA